MAKTRIPNMKISAKMDHEKQQFRSTVLWIGLVALVIFVVLSLFVK